VRTNGISSFQHSGSVLWRRFLYYAALRQGGSASLNHGGIVNQVVGGWAVQYNLSGAERSSDRYDGMGFRGHEFQSFEQTVSIATAGVQHPYYRIPQPNGYLNPAALRIPWAGTFRELCAPTNLNRTRRTSERRTSRRIKDFRFQPRRQGGFSFRMDMLQCSEPCGNGAARTRIGATIMRLPRLRRQVSGRFRSTANTMRQNPIRDEVQTSDFASALAVFLSSFEGFLGQSFRGEGGVSPRSARSLPPVWHFGPIVSSRSNA